MTRWRNWYTGDYAKVMDSKAGTSDTIIIIII